MLARAEHEPAPRPSPLPLPSALLAAELGPAVMADDPCQAAFGEAGPLQASKYYRARYYDPKVGRFLSEDPIGLKAGNNFYTYAENNPTRFTDPSGQSPLDCIPFWDYWGKCQKEVDCCVKRLFKDFEKMTLEQQVLWLDAHGVSSPSDAAFKECFTSNPDCQKMLEYAPKCATSIPFGGWFTRVKIIRRIRNLPF